MRQYPLDTTDKQFTRNWFMHRNYPTFVEYVLPVWKDKPILWLELGTFEAMSTCWCLQHILTHPDSRLVSVDPHLQSVKLDEATMEAVRLRAIHNLQPWTKTGKATLIRGNSAEVLRRMLGQYGNRRGFAGIKRGTVDVCLVDGNHWSLAVMDDLRCVLPLMKVGGQILCDDYANDIDKGDDHVRGGVEMWRAECGDSIKEIWRHRYMIAFERVK